MHKLCIADFFIKSSKIFWMTDFFNLYHLTIHRKNCPDDDDDDDVDNNV